MGAVSELYIMRRSFSADRQVKYQSRSGDDQGGGAVVLDFVANVQSAEADIIEAEEREEQAKSKQQFVRLLRLYLKKILSKQELIFITAYLRSNETPYEVGRSLGLDYYTVIKSIQRKHETNAPKLAVLMRKVSYDYRRGLEFLPSLNAYIKYIECAREGGLKYRKKRKERNREKLLEASQQRKHFMQNFSISNINGNSR